MGGSSEETLVDIPVFCHVPFTKHGRNLGTEDSTIRTPEAHLASFLAGCCKSCCGRHRGRMRYASHENRRVACAVCSACEEKRHRNCDRASDPLLCKYGAPAGCCRAPEEVRSLWPHSLDTLLHCLVSRMHLPVFLALSSGWRHVARPD